MVRKRTNKVRNKLRFKGQTRQLELRVDILTNEKYRRMKKENKNKTSFYKKNVEKMKNKNIHHVSSLCTYNNEIGWKWLN